MNSFVNHDYENIANYERADELTKLAEQVRDFILDICPDEWKPTVLKNYSELNFIVAEKGTGKYTKINNGEKISTKLDAGAYCFADNYNSKNTTCTFSIVIQPNSTMRQIVHELFHQMSGKMFENENEKIAKFGCIQQKIIKGKYGVEKTGSELLNEGITEVLTQRFLVYIKEKENNDITIGSGYKNETLFSQLMVGANVKNNSFIQDIYFGNGTSFERQFNEKSSLVEFDAISKSKNFDITLDQNIALYKSAIENTIKRAETFEQFNAEFNFLNFIIENSRQLNAIPHDVQVELKAYISNISTAKQKELLEQNKRSNFLEADEQVVDPNILSAIKNAQMQPDNKIDGFAKIGTVASDADLYDEEKGQRYHDSLNQHKAGGGTIIGDTSLVNVSSPYERLGISRNAGIIEINEARSRLRKQHRDNPEMIAKIDKSYKLLCDDTARAKWDADNPCQKGISNANCPNCLCCGCN